MKEENLLQGKRILIVDDEKDVLDTLRQLLLCAKSRRPPPSSRRRVSWRQKNLILRFSTSWGEWFELLDIAKKKEIIPVM